MMWRLVLIMLALPIPGAAAVLAAARTLPAGTVITAADLRAVDGERPGLSDPSQAIGLAARITIYEGRPLHASLLEAPRLVRRNQVMRLAFQRGALRIQTEGRTLDEGGAGDLVRVMNLNSRSTITARIQSDGSLLVQD